MLRLTLLSLLVGCQYQIGNVVVPELSDAYSSEMREQWTKKVSTAAAVWYEAVGPGCIEPFPLDGEGSPLVVTMYSPDEWDYSGALGYTPTQDTVEVKGPRPDQPLGLMLDVLVHEFGHVMRLQHDETPHSVMNSNNTNVLPSEEDARRARQYLGCD